MPLRLLLAVIAAASSFGQSFEAASIRPHAGAVRELLQLQPVKAPIGMRFAGQAEKPSEN